jgi:cell wall-associated NlpC family hydrolase
MTLLVSGACASGGARPAPFPRPAPPNPARPSAHPVDAAALVATALALRGVPYRSGGSDRSGFDCSGLVSYVLALHGAPSPRTVREQFALGRSVPRNGLEPGDLVFFSTTARGASHVGIAISGQQFLHAPSSAGAVRVEDLSSRYWTRRWVGARRLD